MKYCNTSSRYIKLLKQLIGGFQLMMVAGAVLCFIAGPLASPVDYQTIYLGLVLIVVVLSTGLFAFYQEAQVDAVMAGFKALTPSRANVVRDGQVPAVLFATEFQFAFRSCIPVHVCPQVIEIDAGELVVGDVVKGTPSHLQPSPPIAPPTSHRPSHTYVTFSVSFGEKVPADVRIIEAINLKVPSSSCF
jgi:magnesium-transporting ATPase (P-type)